MVGLRCPGWSSTPSRLKMNPLSIDAVLYRRKLGTGWLTSIQQHRWWVYDTFDVIICFHHCRRRMFLLESWRFNFALFSGHILPAFMLMRPLIVIVVVYTMKSSMYFNFWLIQNRYCICEILWNARVYRQCSSVSIFLHLLLVFLATQGLLAQSLHYRRTVQ